MCEGKSKSKRIFFFYLSLGTVVTLLVLIPLVLCSVVVVSYCVAVNR
jgi:hypothetical protein